MLYQLSYAPKGDGTRTRNLRVRRNPRLRNRPTSNFKEHDNCRGIVWLRGQGSNPVLLIQSQVWFHFHHLALGLDGEIRTPIPRLPKPVRCRCATSRCSCVVRTDGGIRTRTDGVLSAVPLPLGYVSACAMFGGPRGIRTRNLLLAGELRFQLRHRPRTVRWSRGRESNPRAGRMRPRCTQCPRSVTGRTRTDFLRVHIPASRPLQTSATVDEEGFEPPASSLSWRRSTN